MRKYISIVLGAIAATTFCYLWYSPSFFRSAWLEGLWIKPAKIAAQMETGLWDTWLFTGFAFLFLSLGLHYVISATGCKKWPQKLGTACIVWSLIAAPILFLDFLWEFRRTDLLQLDGLFLLAVFLLMSILYFE